MAQDWGEMEVREMIVPLLVMRENIYSHTMLQPTAVMFPLSLAPGINTVWGLPVIRGDRAALIYESPRIT